MIMGMGPGLMLGTCSNVHICVMGLVCFDDQHD
jgi:hypothetical protein